jgi:Ca-activated chloride channel family protein
MRTIFLHAAALCILQIFAVIFLTGTGVAFQNPFLHRGAKGNEHYEEGEYENALKIFRDLQIDSPESPEIHYNLGNSFYQLQQYEEARNEFERVLASDNRDLHAETYYNIGNCQYRMGKLEEALESYKKALEIHPEDEDAKYNIEFIQKKIKEMMDSASQRLQNQEQQEDGSSQDRKEAPSEGEHMEEQKGEQREERSSRTQSQENTAQEEDKRDASAPQEESMERENDEIQQQAAAAAADSADASDTETGEPSEGMTEEDAERLLNAIAEQEKKVKRQYPVKGNMHAEKDW